MERGEMWDQWACELHRAISTGATDQEAVEMANCLVERLAAKSVPEDRPGPNFLSAREVALDEQAELYDDPFFDQSVEFDD